MGSAQPIPIPQSEPNSLAAATDAVLAALEKSGSACILPGILVARAGLQSQLLYVVNASGLPFAMFMDKSVLDERHPSYIGMYDRKLMNHAVREFVESCDCVLEIGTLVTDFNSGAFTARLDRDKVISICPPRAYRCQVVCECRTGRPADGARPARSQAQSSAFKVGKRNTFS